MLCGSACIFIMNYAITYSIIYIVSNTQYIVIMNYAITFSIIYYSYINAIVNIYYLYRIIILVYHIKYFISNVKYPISEGSIHFLLRICNLYSQSGINWLYSTAAQRVNQLLHSELHQAWIFFWGDFRTSLYYYSTESIIFHSAITALWCLDRSLNCINIIPYAIA